jgi:hypothetical protein
MPAQLLIYESAVPVAQARHGRWSVEVGADYAFTKSVNSVPLTAVEFSNAAREYAIVFAGTGDTVVPAVILGMRADENLYLTGQGGWRAKYIPAFVRRYPFVFASSEDGKTFTLCIDESFRGVNQEGRGQRLFNDERKPTPYVENVLKFLEQYQVEYRRTEVLCKKLRELNLLEPMRAQFDLGSGERLALTGFMAVARDRIKTLGVDTLAELVRTDQLELIYLHLQSLRNFSAMTERLTGGAATPGEQLHGLDSGEGAGEGATAEKAKPSAQEQAAKTTKQRAAKQEK